MSRISFENFGKRAQCFKDYKQMTGRYEIQEEAKKNIFGDIAQKLDLKPDDSVLEIGCGVGDLLIPLSFFVKEITGIDHDSCLEQLRNRFQKAKNIRLVPGNFFDVSMPKSYDKILCYSVIQYLKDKKEVFRFIERALRLLVPEGRALFGDIPNKSKKKRFEESKRGKKFLKEWQRLMKKEKRGKEDIVFPEDKEMVGFDDDLVTEIVQRFRKKGYHVYLSSQPPDLPFGETREDIIFVKPF